MKNDFIIAYCWMYGATKKDALKVYRTANKDYITAVVDGYKNNFKKAFYND